MWGWDVSKEGVFGIVRHAAKGVYDALVQKLLGIWVPSR